MGDIGDAFESPLGLTWALINRHKQKKNLEVIQQKNIDAQGIVYYEPSNIEAFFEYTEPIENIIISGGEEFIRLRALARCMECAYSQGYTPVVLHANNYNLENYLASVFGTTNISYLNGQFPYYDPFIGLTDNEISQIILNSTTENYEIKGLGKYYIDGISAFIRSKKIKPYLWMYITCPHMEFNDKVNDAVDKGLITEDYGRRIMSQIVQGEMERGNIENFFAKLRNEGEYIIAKKNTLSNAVSVNSVAALKGAVVFDIRNSSNMLLINIILSEIEMLKNKGEKVFLCLDGIQVTNNQLLKNYMSSSGGQSPICMLSHDAYADFLGDDKLFYSVLGKTSKVILSKHISAFSCNKYSEFIGSYDKQEITETYTGNLNLIGNFSYGTTSSKNISIKRDNKIKPEVILGLNDDEVFIVDNYNGEIAHTTVI